MPSSNPKLISKIVEAIITINPNSIIDIGCGFGKYGVLCREYLDLNNSEKFGKFKRKIDSIEIFKDYKNPIWEYVYNNIFLKSISDKKFIKSLKHYDLALMIDTLEDVNEKEGIELIETLKLKCRGILISMPTEYWGGGSADFGNKDEIFKKYWILRELKDFGNNIVIYKDYSAILIYIGKKEEIRLIKSSIRKERLKRWLFKFKFILKLKRKNERKNEKAN